MLLLFVTYWNYNHAVEYIPTGRYVVSLPGFNKAPGRILFNYNRLSYIVGLPGARFLTVR